ncbi:MAG: hypothetical protein II776_01440 [Clostridia bacterium]|nr:hypothetical protein [Clostridia bacterium]
MKRSFFPRCLSLLLAALLLTGCAPRLILPETVPETIPAEETVASKTEEEELPTAYEAGVKARLAALPVATDDMPVAERRKLCVDFARLQCSFQWTPTHTFRVEYSRGVNTFQKGVVYGGVPYAHTSSSIYAMMDIYDEETGALLTEPFVKGQSFTSYYGNDCADSIFWAWARVSSSIRYVLTTGMDPHAGCLKLGPYQYNEAEGYFGVTTKGICQANGEQTMYRSYAMCQAADGIVMNNQSKGTGGHARMVSAQAVVVTAPDGTIDGDQSYLVCIEQRSSFTPTDFGGHYVQVQGGIDRKFSFASLFLEGYIPFQIGEVAGLLPVQKAAASLEGEPTAAGLSEADLVSNYRIAKATFVLTNDRGEVVMDRFAYGSESWMYRMPLVSILHLRPAFALRDLEPGSYHLKLTALVGSGETLTAYDGPFTV